MTPARSVLVVAVLVCLVKASLACDGYSLKVKSVRNCVDDPVVKVANDFDVILDSECNLVPKGCVTVAKAFNSAQGRFTLNKPPLPELKGSVDLCDLVASKPIFSELLARFGAPTKCPVQASSICLDGSRKQNIAKFREQLHLALGSASLKIELTHDSGSSCIEAEAEVSKA